MKNFLLFALAFVMVAGCSLSNEVGRGGLETETSEMGGVASLTIELDVGQGDASTKSVIDVEEFDVVGATIALSNSYGEGELKTWKVGDSFVFTFQAKRTGMHTITVTDWDNGGNTNVATATINMKNGKNYRIKVRLGGVIYIGLSGVPRDGLVAEYLFSGNALDTSGNGNNGTVYGAVLTSDRFGTSNSAYKFDGVNSYIIVSNSPSLMISNQITISAWIKVDSFTNVSGYDWAAILTKNNWIDSYGVMIHLSKIIRFYHNGTSNNYSSYTFSDFINNKWYLLTVTYDLTKIIFYIDGKKVFEKFESGYIHNNNNPIAIGKTFGIYNYPFKGIIDDIRIYNRALSDDEVLALYNE